jgi:hypothetical protein
LAIYEWKDEDGNIAVTDKYNTPPDSKKQWQRVFSFGLSSINGAGGSPSRPPLFSEKSHKR